MSEINDTIDAVGLHFRRLFEKQSEESLQLAVALRDATEKNGRLMGMAEQLRSENETLRGEIARLRGEVPAAHGEAEIIPPAPKTAGATKRPN